MYSTSDKQQATLPLADKATASSYYSEIINQINTPHSLYHRLCATLSTLYKVSKHSTTMELFFVTGLNDDRTNLVDFAVV